MLVAVAILTTAVAPSFVRAIARPRSHICARRVQLRWPESRSQNAHSLFVCEHMLNYALPWHLLNAKVITLMIITDPSGFERFR